MEVGGGGKVVTPGRCTVKGKMVDETIAAPPAAWSQLSHLFTAVRCSDVQTFAIEIATT